MSELFRIAGHEVEEPRRRTPVLHTVDVLVVGGGPSGVCAAVAASRAGARTMLIERHGFLGGMWTAGLVTTLAGFNTWLKPYRRCVGGVAGEWLQRATALGMAEDNESWVLNSDPEGMKLVADEILEQSRTECLFHTWCATAIMDGNRVAGAIVENVEGRHAILAGVTVDCTGNGDVVARSGAKWVKGHTLQPMTMPFRIAGIKLDPQRSHITPRRIPIGPEPVEIAGPLLVEWTTPRSDITFSYEAMQEARRAGELPLFGGPWFGGLYKDEVWVNATRIVGDGSVARELSRAETEGRRNCFQMISYFRRTIPGFENARIVQTSPQVGIRETRRMVGAYTLTEDDIRSQVEFDDTIALGCWPIDIHPVEATGYHAMYVPRPFGIPFRSLIPESTDGLLAAGRCLSADRAALASIRVGAQCAATGHAAGAAAALAVKRNVAPRGLDVAELQRLLKDQGAILDNPVARGRAVGRTL